MMEGKWNWRRSGLVTAQNEPSALETLTTTGFSDFSKSGSAAWVTRMMPIALVSNTSRATWPSTSAVVADSGVVYEDVEVAFSVGDDAKSGLD